MSLTASQIFDSIAPQYASDPEKSTFLSLASDRTNNCFYGSNANQAIALRAAHMITLSKRTTGESGSISSKKEGDLAVSYFKGSASSSGSDLGLTHYGIQLKGLTRGSGPFIGVTGGSDNGC